MGMFDSLMIKCKNCRNTLEFQSKSGACCLYIYHKNNIPSHVAVGMIGDVVKCSKCKAKWKLLGKPTRIKVRLSRTFVKEDYES